MRMFVGIILGCALTIGSAYVVDHTAPPLAARPMVNWDVVAKTVDDVAALAREGWKKIAG
jgi:hypothetical protein